MTSDDFHSHIHLFFDKLSKVLEPLSRIDYDEMPGFFMVTLPDTRVYLFNIYEPLQQLWMSSPISGGRHFALLNTQWLDTRTEEELWFVLSNELWDHYRYEIDEPFEE